MSAPHNLQPHERPATRRLEAALVRLEAAAARARDRHAAARALADETGAALADLDRVLERPRG